MVPAIPVKVAGKEGFVIAFENLPIKLIMSSCRFIHSNASQFILIVDLCSSLALDKVASINELRVRYD